MSIIEIRMPEEANEGTEASLGRWLKKAGDSVQEHEPLIEISTDKVTIEVPSPATGILAELTKAPGDTVQPDDLLGRISLGGEAATLAPPAVVSSAPQPATMVVADEETYSPGVRRLLKQHNLDAQAIPRLSRGARLTSDDVEAFLASADPAANVSSSTNPLPAGHEPAATGRLVPHTPMRKSIASHMARSVQNAPHVTAVFEADLSQVLADRTRRKADDPATVPSVTAYLMRAAVAAIQKFPEVNSKWHDAHLEVFDRVHFGIGTALEAGGLVVPVIRDAHTLDLMALSGKLREMTAKARAGKLTQADMQGGTFTLSNHGVSGSLLAAPIIIPDGQAAILGAGKMQKRVIVCETGGRELFRVRPMMYVTLTVDHRVLDGQQTNGFLSAFVAALETPDEANAR